MEESIVRRLQCLHRFWLRPWVQVLLLDVLLFVGWDLLYDNWADVCLSLFVPFLFCFNVAAAAVAALCRWRLWRWLLANAFVASLIAILIPIYNLIAS